MPSLWSLAGAAIRPDPGPARTWVERELGRPEYHQSLVERFFGWLQELWERLQVSALNASPLSTGAAVLTLAVLAVLVGLLVSRARREPSRTVQHDGVLGPGAVSAQQHRDAALAALARASFGEAVVEAFRAVATRSVERGLLQERPGLTAHELAESLAPVFPAQVAALREAALRFDLVFYGGQRAVEADARAVLDLDERLHRTRPATPAERSEDLTVVVPR
jgi:Domain of unknown function (DUF4129)